MLPQPSVRLTRIYHRNLAKRLADNAARQDAETMNWRNVRWLHPRAVWAARAAESQELRESDLASAFQHGERPPPPLEHVAGVEEEWVRAGFDGPASLSPHADPNTMALFDEALDVLRRVWPSAAVEYQVLIRCLIHMRNSVSQSGTSNISFGAIYVDTTRTRDLVRSVETILHETGHHSLLLRNAFIGFLENPDDLSGHSFRPEPRPVYGCLHAAYALGRIATGLSRWAESEAAPSDRLLARRDRCVFMYGETLDSLEKSARWTADGANFHQGLVEQRDLLSR